MEDKNRMIVTYEVKDIERIVAILRTIASVQYDNGAKLTADALISVAKELAFYEPTKGG